MNENENNSHMPNSKAQPFQKAGTYIKSQFGKPLSSASDAMSDTNQSAFLLLFYYLSIDEIRMGFFYRLFGASSFSGFGKHFELMVELKQCIVI